MPRKSAALKLRNFNEWSLNLFKKNEKAVMPTAYVRTSELTKPMAEKVEPQSTPVSSEMQLPTDGRKRVHNLIILDESGSMSRNSFQQINAKQMEAQKNRRPVGFTTSSNQN